MEQGSLGPFLICTAGSGAMCAKIQLPRTVVLRVCTSSKPCNRSARDRSSMAAVRPSSQARLLGPLIQCTQQGNCTIQSDRGSSMGRGVRGALLGDVGMLAGWEQRWTMRSQPI